jgi:hypothetical protein
MGRTGHRPNLRLECRVVPALGLERATGRGSTIWPAAIARHDQVVRPQVRTAEMTGGDFAIIANGAPWRKHFSHIVGIYCEALCDMTARLAHLLDAGALRAADSRVGGGDPGIPLSDAKCGA